MALIINKKLGDDVPHSIMQYHGQGWGDTYVTNMTDYIVRSTNDEPNAHTFGLEIECTKLDSAITNTELEKMFELFPYMQAARDGSVPSNVSGSAVELTTVPMTPEAWKESGFKKLLEYMRERGFKAYCVTNTDDPNESCGCGGHIHINKGDDWEEVAALMAMFIDQNKHAVQMIAHRDFTHYAQNNLASLNKSNKRYSLEYIKGYMRANRNVHENALNLQHNATIEFRLPVGTLDYELKMSHIEFLNNLYKCCDDVVHGRARIDRLTINKVCKDGDFLPTYMNELGLSCSKKLLILDKEIKAKIDAYNVDKCKVVKALSDLQLAIAMTNASDIRQGSINTITRHFNDITGATDIDVEMYYLKNLKGQNVISQGLNQYSESHNDDVTKAYKKLKDVLAGVTIPQVYEDMKGEK